MTDIETIDQARYASSHVMKATGLDKETLQSWLARKHIVPRVQAHGTGSKRLFSARDIVSVEILKRLSGLVQPSLASEWACTSFVSNLTWWAWVIDHGDRPGEPYAIAIPKELTISEILNRNMGMADPSHTLTVVPVAKIAQQVLARLLEIERLEGIGA